MTFHGFLMGSALTALLLAPATAHAKMDENKIQAFLDETTALTHQDSLKTADQVRRYLEKHIADDGHFSSTITYDIPGYPAQAREITLDKAGFIDNVIQGRDSMENYHSDVSLTATQIDRKGKNATIQTTTTERGQSAMDGQTMVPFEGRSDCQQVLREDGGDIVLVSAICQTTVSFKE